MAFVKLSAGNSSLKLCSQVRGTPWAQITEDLVQHRHWPLGARGNEDTSWRIQDHPSHSHQLTQFPRTVTLQLSTGTRGNTQLLFLQQPPKNKTVLQPPQQTSVLLWLKALGSAPARDYLPSRMSAGGVWYEKGVGGHDTGPLPCRPLPRQAWYLGGLAPPPPLPGSTCMSLLTGSLLCLQAIWRSILHLESDHCGTCLWDQDLAAVVPQSPAYAGSL